MWDPYAEFESTTLLNGLTIHAAHWPGRSWEALKFVVHTGAENDPPGLEGLSHFLEHVVGDSVSAPRKDLEDYVESYGGRVGWGSTSYFSTEYGLFLPVQQSVLSKAVDFFAELLVGARIEKFIERERQVILGEFRKGFQFKFEEELKWHERKVLYPGLGLERFITWVGDPVSINRVTKEDLQNHYRFHYTPMNISVVGVGGMSLAQLENLLGQSQLADQIPGLRTPLPEKVSEFIPLTENRLVFELSQHAKMTTSPDHCNFRSIARLPGTIFRQGGRILGSALYEVLFDEIRQKRAWAYKVRVYRNNYRKFWSFTITCDGVSLNARNEIENVINSCIDSLYHNRKLFLKIKNKFIRKLRLNDETGEEVCASAMDDLADEQRIVTLQDVENDLDKITFEDYRSLFLQ